MKHQKRSRIQKTDNYPAFLIGCLFFWFLQVRWALDLCGMPYTEDAHPPGFSMFHTLPATQNKVSAVPVLILPPSLGGETLCDSSNILRTLAKKNPDTFGFLYPHGKRLVFPD